MASRWERTTAKGTGRGKGTRYRIGQPVAYHPRDSEVGRSVIGSTIWSLRNRKTPLRAPLCPRAESLLSRISSRPPNQTAAADKRRARDRPTAVLSAESDQDAAGRSSPPSHPRSRIPPPVPSRSLRAVRAEKPRRHDTQADHHLPIDDQAHRRRYPQLGLACGSNPRTHSLTSRLPYRRHSRASLVPPARRHPLPPPVKAEARDLPPPQAPAIHPAVAIPKGHGRRTACAHPRKASSPTHSLIPSLFTHSNHFPPRSRPAIPHSHIFGRSQLTVCARSRQPLHPAPVWGNATTRHSPTHYAP